MVRSGSMGNCLKQVVKEGLSKEMTLNGDVENEEGHGQQGAGR